MRDVQCTADGIELAVQAPWWSVSLTSLRVVVTSLKNSDTKFWFYQ